MFVLDRTSTCAVCWEPFGIGEKGPCAIPCGHVFCVDCIRQLERNSCPLCRVDFQPQSIVKLFLGEYTDTPLGLSADQKEARRLQEEITSITNEGSTETRLRQLIAECKEFLSSKPRDLYSDFRTSYKMLAYLCEVKTTLRTREASVESLTAQVASLKEEKTKLEERIKEMEKVHKEERQAALTMEQNLREHCIKAHAAYETVVNCYNTVVKECSQLREDVQRLAFLPASFREPPISTSFESRISRTSPALSAKLSQTDLKGAAIADPNSFLISPLPEFSGRLPSTLETFTALPDVEEEIYPRSPAQRSSPSPPTRDTCTAIGHPYSCQCAPYSLFPDSFDSHSLLSTPEEPPNHNVTIVEDYDQTAALPIPIPRSQQQHHHHTGLSVPKSYDSDKYGRSRSHSHSSQQSNTKISRPPSPVKHESGRRRRTSPEKRQNADRTITSPGIPIPQDPETLRNRLHELLQDTSSVPSSLASTSHFPSSLGRGGSSREREPERGRDRAPSRPPSRTAFSPVRNPPSPHILMTEGQSAPHPSHDVYPPPPPPSTVPPQPPRISTASAAAQAFASQKERQRALEKEKERERRRQEKAERERLRAEAKAQHVAVSASLATASVSAQAQLATSSYQSINGLSAAGAVPPSLTRRDSTQNRPGSAMPGSAPSPYYPYQQPQRHESSSRKGLTASAATSRSYA
ncbi:hypothetical protein AX16_003300 [Volvariella volvacea WC 439]|nr:hypothetical protein AX16_003300 [Volvariella volvacea WC 439]